MSLQPRPIPEIPELTAQVARAAFPKGTLAIRIRNELGGIYEDEQFVDLYSQRGQSTLAPWRLALLTVLQFVENLSDRQVADAVRGRIDWKYALSLELSDPGFDFSVLSEFRDRLVAGQAEELLLTRLLERLRERGLLKSYQRQRTDSTHVLAAVRKLNRLETLGETLRAALNSLSVAAPDWLRSQLRPDWLERYSRRVENYRMPKSDQDRAAMATTIAADGLAFRTYAAALAVGSSQEEQSWLQFYYQCIKPLTHDVHQAELLPVSVEQSDELHADSSSRAFAAV